MTNDAMNRSSAHRRYFAPWALVIASLVIASAALAQLTTNSLPSSLAELTKPAKKIPFKTVIEATTGHRVLDLDTNNAAHASLHTKLLKAARLAGERANRDGIVAARPNEAGNYLEPFVRAALKECGLEAQIPRTTQNRAQVTGYPDIEITEPTPCYLELKTYNAKTVNTTQRSFYYSPSAAPKVTHDALHLLLAFELTKIDRDGKSVFVPTHWKLLSLSALEVDLKFEFNQSNRGLYGDTNATLSEGAVQLERN
jgi:hypothetical protein